MKNKIMLVLVLVVAVCLIAAVPMPPTFPSSFWGSVNVPVGASITTSLGGSGITQTYQGVTYYSIEVPGPHPEGTPLTFYVNGIKAGTGYFHSGWNQQVNLLVPIVPSRFLPLPIVRRPLTVAGIQ